MLRGRNFGKNMICNQVSYEYLVGFSEVIVEKVLRYLFHWF